MTSPGTDDAPDLRSTLPATTRHHSHLRRATIMPPRIRSCLVPLLLVAAACGDQGGPFTTGVDHVEATFHPIQVDGVPVPFATSAPTDTCQSLDLGATLTLFASGRFELHVVQSITVCNGQFDGSFGSDVHGTYTLGEGKLTLSADGGYPISTHYIPEQGAQGDIPIPGVQVTLDGTNYLMMQDLFEVPGVHAPQAQWSRGRGTP